MGFKLQIRRGMEADLPQLDNGEVGYTQDTHKFFVGTPEGNRQLTFDQTKYDEYDSQLESVNTQLADTQQKTDVIKNSIGISIEDYPLIAPELNDTARVKRAYDALGTAGGFIRFPAGTFKFNLEVIKSNVKLVGSGRNVTLFMPADDTKPIVSIGNGIADVRYVSVEKVRLMGGTSTSTNKPTNDGIVMNGVMYSSLNEVEVTQCGGDNIRITASATRASMYIFMNDIITHWSAGACLRIDKGLSWVSTVFISNFSIQGDAFSNSKAVWITDSQAFLSNGNIHTQNGKGHVYLEGSTLPMLYCNNVSIDSGSSADTMVEVTSTATKVLSTYITGAFTMNGRWKRGDGTVLGAVYEGAMSSSRYAKLQSPHIVDRIYFSDINATEPDNRSQAKNLYRDGVRIRTFFDDTNFPSGLYLGAFTSTPPTSSISYGKAGYWSANADYLYVCIADNSWIRIAKDVTAW